MSASLAALLLVAAPALAIDLGGVVNDVGNAATGVANNVASAATGAANDVGGAASGGIGSAISGAKDAVGGGVNDMIKDQIKAQILKNLSPTKMFLYIGLPLICGFLLIIAVVWFMISMSRRPSPGAPASGNTFRQDPNSTEKGFGMAPAGGPGTGLYPTMSRVSEPEFIEHAETVNVNVDPHPYPVEDNFSPSSNPYGEPPQGPRDVAGEPRLLTRRV